jgi:hypothetical protein
MKTKTKICVDYVTKFVICPKCNEKAGYTNFFDFKTIKVFKCDCEKGIREIKNENT